MYSELQKREITTSIAYLFAEHAESNTTQIIAMEDTLQQKRWVVFFFFHLRFYNVEISGLWQDITI